MIDRTVKIGSLYFIFGPLRSSEYSEKLDSYSRQVFNYLDLILIYISL